jgi:hypothetical protein
MLLLVVAIATLFVLIFWSRLQRQLQQQKEQQQKEKEKEQKEKEKQKQKEEQLKKEQQQKEKEQLVQRRIIYCLKDHMEIGRWLQMVVDQNPTITLLFISCPLSWDFDLDGGRLKYNGREYHHPKPDLVMWVAIQSEVRLDEVRRI